MSIKYVIRDAERHDIPQLARLFNELGHPIDAASISSNWDEWKNAGNAAIVAEQADGSILAVITLHHMRVLHRPYLVGRFTSLIVTASVRGQGIGRALVTAAENWLVEQGCELIEITSNVKLTEAHAFYEHLDYAKTSVRLAKAFGAKAN